MIGSDSGIDDGGVWDFEIANAQAEKLGYMTSFIPTTRAVKE